MNQTSRDNLFTPTLLSSQYSSPKALSFLGFLKVTHNACLDCLVLPHCLFSQCFVFLLPYHWHTNLHKQLSAKPVWQFMPCLCLCFELWYLSVCRQCHYYLKITSIILNKGVITASSFNIYISLQLACTYQIIYLVVGFFFHFHNFLHLRGTEENHKDKEVYIKHCTFQSKHTWILSPE